MKPDAGKSHPALEAIANHVAVLSDEHVQIGEEEICISDVNWQTQDAHQRIESPLRYSLHRLLYSRFYTRGTASPGSQAETSPVDPSPAEEGADLQSPPGLRMDHGWRIKAVLPNGSIAAEKGNAISTFGPGQFLNSAGPAAPKVDGEVSVHVLAESSTHLPGFHFHFGQAPAEPIPSMHPIRFYLNCTEVGAKELARQISTRFDHMLIPFRLKHPVRTEQFARCDSLVVYVRPDHLVPAFRQLSEIRVRTSSMLEEKIPLFTRRLAPGFAIAESPPDGRSFGSHRCDLIAAGLERAFRNQCTKPEAQLEQILKMFSAKGVPPDRPHLNDARDTWGIDVLEAL